MQEKRKGIRHCSRARVSIPALFEGDAFLKDVSVTGCCIEYARALDIKPNANYTIQILPETVTDIGKFDLLVEFRWTRSIGTACEVGFMVVESPKGKQFQMYVDYLAWQTSPTSEVPQTHSL